jgi:uncharacterized protein YjbI with pentapeptide repeats
LDDASPRRKPRPRSGAKLRPPRRTRTPPSPPKPAIAEKAHDLEAIRKALEDATSVGAGFWLSYLFLMFYIAIAAGAVTHVDLLLENPVRLPFLNVELPLKAFFFLAPILFLIVHSFTLSKLVILSDKARRFHEELIAQIPDAADRDALRRQLPSNIFVQGLAGPKSARESPFGWLLRAMGWTSMVVAPVLLLLLLQLQFLPYHETWLTWLHRLALLADLVLLWWLWPKVRKGYGEEKSKWIPFSLFAASRGASLAVLLFAWFVATFPGEWQEMPLLVAAQFEPKTLTDWIFEKASTLRLAGVQRWPSNRLFLPDFDFVEALRLDDPKKLDWREHTLDLRYRRLENANLERAKLSRADLRFARLQGAWLLASHLEKASLDCALLQGASLPGAQMDNASLWGTHLEGAALDGAQLRLSSLLATKLQGASLVGAGLQGAALIGTQLQAARLDHANLQVADVRYASLRGVSALNAQLQGASLDTTDLSAAELSGTYLWRSTWSKPILVGVYADDLHWGPEAEEKTKNAPWSIGSYTALLEALNTASGGTNKESPAFARLDILKCEKMEASVCATPSWPQTDEKEQRLSFEAGSPDRQSYGFALTETLRDILCDGNPSAIHVLRSVAGGGNIRIHDTGPNAPALVDFVMGEKCPLSTSLTKEDKARLKEIKQYAQERYPNVDPSRALSANARSPFEGSPPGILGTPCPPGL